MATKDAKKVYDGVYCKKFSGQPLKYILQYY